MTGKICFATRDLVEGGRASFVCDFYGRAFMGFELSPLDDTDFDIDVSVVRLGTVAVAHGSISPLTATRACAPAANRSANLLLGMADSDFTATDADSVAHEIRAGSILFMPLDQTFTWTVPEVSTITAIHLDRAALLSHLPGLEFDGVRCISAETPGSNLLFSYVKALHQSEGVSADAAALISRQILDLTAFVIGRTSNSDESDGSAGVRRGRFLAAKRDVSKHFHDPTLSIHDVATRQNVTSRYLQILFEENGTTFTNYLQGIRLDFAHERLRQAKSPIRILDIALEAGFAELSTFNRLFRKRFGNTPSSFKSGRREAKANMAG